MFFTEWWERRRRERRERLEARLIKLRYKLRLALEEKEYWEEVQDPKIASLREQKLELVGQLEAILSEERREIERKLGVAA